LKRSPAAFSDYCTGNDNEIIALREST